MDLSIKRKCGSVFNCFNQKQIEELENNMVVVLPDKGKVVIYSEEEPCDGTFPWQPTNGCGEPVGKVKNYNSDTGIWE